jgi:hypothetical protein
MVPLPLTPAMSLRVAVAAHESFRDAFADVPPSASRGFVEALIPYMEGYRKLNSKK